jgi:hypothetical protein
MLIVTIIWGIISIIYLILAIFQFIWSRVKFPPLQFKGKIAKINGIPLGIGDAVTDINKFIDRFNEHNKRMNMAQFYGFLAAFIVALISLVISLVTNK